MDRVMSAGLVATQVDAHEQSCVSGVVDTLPEVWRRKWGCRTTYSTGSCTAGAACTGVANSSTTRHARAIAPFANPSCCPSISHSEPQTFQALSRSSPTPVPRTGCAAHCAGHWRAIPSTPLTMPRCWRGCWLRVAGRSSIPESNKARHTRLGLITYSFDVETDIWTGTNQHRHY